MKNFRLIPLGVGLSLVVLAGCSNNFTSSALREVEGKRLEKLLVTQTDLRGKAVLTRMWNCIFWGDDTHWAALEEQHHVLVAKNGRGNNLTQEEFEKAGDAAEATCGDRLIEATIVGNPRGAAALADFLMARGYHVSDEARAMAKPDDNALSLALESQPTQAP